MWYKSYLHDILPPLSISIVVVVSIIRIYILLLEIDTAAVAAFLSNRGHAVCPDHVDEANDGEQDRDRDQGVVHDFTCEGQQTITPNCPLIIDGNTQKH